MIIYCYLALSFYFFLYYKLKNTYIYIYTEMGLRPSGFRFGPILGKPVLRISHAKRMLP